MPDQDSVSFACLGVIAFMASTFAVQANICDDAAQKAAVRSTVPVDVLLTITRLETGRGDTAEPWPWAVNQAGNGTWFNSEDDARSFVFSEIKAGKKNIDIGCFQINYRWHAEEFRSLDDMFDPYQNALYAAEFLTQLHDEFGSWEDAAGAYHSRTPEFGKKYQAKFRQYRANVEQLDLPPPTRRSEAVTQPRIVAVRGAGSLFIDRSNGLPFIDIGRIK
ncbi:lytic transglycosylase domain-containing protein [Marivita sp. S0852]|uniref:lytic transglycosylase domain-containing protein n=1 Tax=Marivita sp. S0852 TaxID=3373893 RepID=UPI0039823774